jgi:hypothetical protein
MAGTKEGGRKARETKLARDPNVYSNMGKRNVGLLKPNSGFGSKEIGDDGLTGKQRAKLAGSIGGRQPRKKKTG